MIMITSSFTILRKATEMFLYVSCPSLTAIRVRRKSSGYVKQVAVAPAHAPAINRWKGVSGVYSSTIIK